MFCLSFYHKKSDVKDGVAVVMNDLRALHIQTHYKDQITTKSNNPNNY